MLLPHYSILSAQFKPTLHSKYYFIRIAVNPCQTTSYGGAAPADFVNPNSQTTNFSLTVHRYIRGGWIGKDGTLATLGKMLRVGKVGNLDKIDRIGNLARTAGFEPATTG